MQDSEMTDNIKYESVDKCEVLSDQQHCSDEEKLNVDVSANTVTNTKSTGQEVNKNNTQEMTQSREFPQQAANLPSSCEVVNTRQQTETTKVDKSTSTTSNKKVGANSYYYWHGHEKERAKVGDVAPLPTPVLVKKHEEVVLSPVLSTSPITKYSWSDDGNVITIYIETGHGCASSNNRKADKQVGSAAAQKTSAEVSSVNDDKNEVLESDSVNVKFTKYTCEVNFITRVPSKNGLQRRKRLLLHLSKKIKPVNSSYKVKPSLKEIVVKLTKANDGTWFDLTGKDRSAVSSSSSSSSASSQNSDSDDETTQQEEEQQNSNNL